MSRSVTVSSRDVMYSVLSTMVEDDSKPIAASVTIVSELAVTVLGSSAISPVLAGTFIELLTIFVDPVVSVCGELCSVV